MRSKLIMMIQILKFCLLSWMVGLKVLLVSCSECAGYMVEGYYKLLPLSSK